MHYGDSRTMQSDKARAANAQKTSQPPRGGPPVRLPKATEDLVNRLLARRCGSGVQPAC